ncbi:MPPV-166 hypothetical protein [Magpiepox virus 2]|nr:MPPV-166 hypothetical protein [Magpiepox virus 2]
MVDNVYSTYGCKDFLRIPLHLILRNGSMQENAGISKNNTRKVILKTVNDLDVLCLRVSSYGLQIYDYFKSSRNSELIRIYRI